MPHQEDRPADDDDQIQPLSIWGTVLFYAVILAGLALTIAYYQYFIPGL